MITNKIKFFEKSVLSTENQAVVNTTDSSDGSFVLENFRRWEALSSAPVTLTINFTNSECNRLLILDHNLSDFNISVSAMNIRDGSGTFLGNDSIRVSGNVAKNSYFYFDTSFIDQLTINAIAARSGRKAIGRIVMAREIGTMEGYPEIANIQFSPNSRNVKSKSGRLLITKQLKTLKTLQLNCKGYNHLGDISLLKSLYDKDDSFLIWPKGNTLEDDIRFPIEGMRPQDIYLVQTMGDFKTRLTKGSYSGLIDATAKFTESI